MPEKTSPPRSASKVNATRGTPVLPKRAVVNETCARYYRQPAQSKLLLPVNIVVKPLAVRQRREVQVANKAVFVFKAVTHRGVRPAALDVIALIFKAGAIDVVEPWAAKSSTRAGSPVRLTSL